MSNKSREKKAISLLKDLVDAVDSEGAGLPWWKHEEIVDAAMVNALKFLNKLDKEKNEQVVLVGPASGP